MVFATSVRVTSAEGGRRNGEQFAAATREPILGGVAEKNEASPYSGYSGSSVARSSMRSSLIGPRCLAAKHVRGPRLTDRCKDSPGAGRCRAVQGGAGRGPRSGRPNAQAQNAVREGRARFVVTLDSVIRSEHPVGDDWSGARCGMASKRLRWCGTEANRLSGFRPSLPKRPCFEWLRCWHVDCLAGRNPRRARYWSG